MFVNTLVLRTEVDPDAKMVELLDHVRKVDLEAFANSHLPFEFLVTELMPVRSEAFAPLVQVLLSVEDGFGRTASANSSHPPKVDPGAAGGG